MMKQLLYATTNPGKIKEMRQRFEAYNIPIVSPKDIGIKLEVQETGNTLEENARIKAKAYIEKTNGRYVVLADDTGLEIEALNNEPGIHVRRWKDGKTRMNDEEIIQYCIRRMKDVPEGKRGAQFRAVFAVGTTAQNLLLFDGVILGEILTQPKSMRIEGYPFEPLFYVPKWQMLFADLHKIPSSKIQKYPTHRGVALQKALTYIRQLGDI